MFTTANRFSLLHYSITLHQYIQPMPEKMPCHRKLRAQARLLTNLFMYVNSKSTRQTACTHTKPDMHVNLSALSCQHSVRDRRPTGTFGCSRPLTASMDKFDVGESRRAFVRVRMWSRGPLHCSEMTLLPGFSCSLSELVLWYGMVKMR